MILAAVIPYHHPRGAGRGRASSCIVRVADGGRVLAEEWIEVGYLVPVDGGDRLTRVVGPAQVAAVAAQAAVFMVRHGAGLARVEIPSGTGVEAQRGANIGAALSLAFPRVEPVPQAKGDLAARWAALLGVEVLGSDPEVPASLRAPVTGIDAAVGVEVVGLGAPHGSGSKPQDERAQVAHAVDHAPALAFPQAPKAGRRIAGIDPGSRHIAVAVVEELRIDRKGGVEEHPVRGGTGPSDGTRGGDEAEHECVDLSHAAQSTPGHTGPQAVARLVAWLPLTIGRDVPLRKPRVIERKDGATYTKTTRHEVTDEDVLQLLRDVAAFLAEHDVDAAVVESATHAHAGAGALLLRSQAIGGEIAGWLRAAGLPVQRVASATWRAQAKKRAGLRATRKGEQDGEIGSGRGPGDHRGPGVQTGDRRPGEVPPDGAREPLQEGRDRLSDVRESGGERDRATDIAWPAAVRALVTGLPTLPPDAREHVLDAVGAAVWALAPPPEPEPAKPRERVAKGTRKRGAKPAREYGPKVPRVLSCKKCGGPRAGHVRGLPCPERGAGE